MSLDSCGGRRAGKSVQQTENQPTFTLVSQSGQLVVPKTIKPREQDSEYIILQSIIMNKNKKIQIGYITNLYYESLLLFKVLLSAVT